MIFNLIIKYCKDTPIIIPTMQSVLTYIKSPPLIIMHTVQSVRHAK